MMKLGIDRVAEFKSVFANKRVGLITNPTGITSDFRSSVEVLWEHANLVCLFSPEHGVRGNLQAGVRFESYIDDVLNIMVHSLYTKDKKPTPEMLDTIDILAIDIQDGGSRFYTYIYTMAYAMQACAEHDKEFVVFDRPNPIGNKVEGNILNLEFRSFVGYYPIVQRHGMTIGELAQMFNEAFEIGCKLTVIPMENYNPTLYYEDQHKLWIAPSPNFPTINTAIVYNGTCIFEGTNISEGRGTTQPFEFVGAPFIDPYKLSDALNNSHLKGVYFRPTYFVPTFSKHKNEVCGGVFVHVLDRDVFEPVATGWTMLEVIRTMYPEDFKVLPPYTPGRPQMLSFNTGTDKITNHELSLDEQLAWLKRDTKRFETFRKPYLLYEVKHEPK